VRPEADFQLEYEKEALRVAPLQDCKFRFVDLEGPRGGVSETAAEFGYGQCGDFAKPRMDVVDDVPISAGDNNAIARDCAEAIRNGPINEPLTPSAQTSLCLLTSATTAEQEGITRKMVLVTIDSIAEDGTLSLLVTAWSVPS